MELLENIKRNIKRNLTFLSQRAPKLYDEIVSQRIWERPIMFQKSNGDMEFHYYDEIVKNLQSISAKKVETFEENLQVLYFNPYNDTTSNLWNFTHMYLDRLDLKERAKRYKRNIEQMIVFGLLPFFHLEKILESFLDRRQFARLEKVVIVEHNIELFYAYLMVCDLEKIYNLFDKSKVKLQLLVPKNEDEVFQFFYSLFPNIGDTSLDIYGFYASYNSQKTTQYIDKAYELINMNYILIPHHFLDNALQSLPYNINYPYLCKKKPNHFIDKPVFIVGSGPSLQDHIDWIKENRNKIYILSLTSTFKILAQNGITPDAVVVVDAGVGIGEGKNEVFKEAIDRLSNVDVVGTIEIDYKICELAKNTYMISSEFFPHIIDSRCDSLNKAPTVFVHALELAIRSGFSKIYAVGIDLGTTDPEQFYAQGYGERYSHTYLPYTYEGNFGDKVYTKADYLTTKTVAEYVVKTANPQIKFFNLSYGLKIAGFEPIRKEKIELRDSIVLPFGEIVVKSFEVFSSTPLRQERLQEEITIGKETLDLLKKIRSRLKKESIDVKTLLKYVKKLIEMKHRYRKETGGVLFKVSGLILYFSSLLSIVNFLNGIEEIEEPLQRDRKLLLELLERFENTLKAHNKAFGGLLQEKSILEG